MAAFRRKSEIDVTQFPPRFKAATFYGNVKSIPTEFKQVIPLLHACTVSQKKTIRQCVARVVQYMLDGDTFDNPENGLDTYQAFQESLMKENNALSVNDCNLIITALHGVIRFAVNSKTYTATIVANLKEMHVPEPVADDLGNAINKCRSALETNAVIKSIGFPKISSFRWRVDVVISSGSLSRVMRPNIVTQLALSDGRIVLFDMSIHQFNQLRYGVAKMLQNMSNLERHPMMRIENEEESKRVRESKK